MFSGRRSCFRLVATWGFVALLFTSAVAQRQVRFRHRTYQVNPVDVATGDMNHDGLPDVVSANGELQTVNVLLNIGNGRFLEPGRVFFAGQRPCAIALADFNADGNLDVAVPDCDSPSVDVLFGTSAGSLVNRIELPLIGHAYSIAVADFNSDGRPDIAVAMGDMPRIAIYFSKGGTRFTPPRDFAVGDSFTTSLGSITAGDINGDGRTDLAVLACCKTRFQQYLYRLDNHTFARQTNQPRFFQRLVETGTGSSVRLVDIDKDGLADYLVPYYADPACEIEVGCFPIQGMTWIFNNRDGSTTKSGYVVSPDGVFWVAPGSAVADFNGDGLNDPAVGVDGSRDIHGAVRYLLAAGPRTFAPAQFVSLEPEVGLVALAADDFNRDGLADLVAANRQGAADVLLARRTFATSGQGLCAAPPSPGVRICSPTRFQQGDITLFQASASAPRGQTVKTMRLYVDHVAQYSTNNSSLITAKRLPAGVHKIVVNAWTSGGRVFTAEVFFGR